MSLQLLFNFQRACSLNFQMVSPSNLIRSNGLTSIGSIQSAESRSSPPHERNGFDHFMIHAFVEILVSCIESWMLVSHYLVKILLLHSVTEIQYISAFTISRFD